MKRSEINRLIESAGFTIRMIDQLRRSIDPLDLRFVLEEYAPRWECINLLCGKG